MAVTEERVVDNPSWIQRLGSSFKGVLLGIALFIAGFPILFWNEGRAVATAKRLAEGAGAVVDVPADKIDAANEGKLVHVSGKADTQDVLSDEGHSWGGYAAGNILNFRTENIKSVNVISGFASVETIIWGGYR